jgi:hypothetical protein
VAAAVALVPLTVGLALGAADDAHADPGLVTVQGYVRNADAQGRPGLAVSYYDERQHGTNVRPLTPAEVATGVRPGDPLPVTYRTGPATSRARAVADGGAAALCGLLALALLLRPLLFRVRLARIGRTTARAVEVVAWVRVLRGRPWLVIWPDGETRARRAVAVPLDSPGELPAAIAGTVYVHGRIEGGHAVVVREPAGTALWPRGPARGAWWAQVTGIGVAPPQPPVVHPGWGHAPVW